MRYAVVIEKGPKSYGAYVPDLPGCVAVGKTQDEVLAAKPTAGRTRSTRQVTKKPTRIIRQMLARRRDRSNAERRASC